MNIYQTALDRLMNEILHAQNEPNSRDFDYFSSDQDTVFEVRLRRQGIRDLRDAMLQMASYLGSSRRRFDRGIVLISLTRSSASRILEEWMAAKSVLLPDVAKRLRLVAIVDGKVVTEPSDSEMEMMAEKFRSVATQVETNLWSRNDAEELWSKATATRQLTTSWKHLEVEKLLVHRWLMQEGPIGIGKMAATVGCSYPTVKEATRSMVEEGIVRVGTGGTLELLKYSRERWSALIAASRRIYIPKEYVDVTGEPKATESLLTRLSRPSIRFDGVAIGGVAAGRYWNSRFDLNGTPRVDLVVHVPFGQDHAARFDLKSVHRLDPALKERRGEQMHRSTVLAIHPIYRKDALFRQDSNQTLPWADPVETILHLNDMGLTAQASDLVSMLRSRKLLSREQR